MKFYTIILNFNGWDDTEKCLASLNLPQSSDFNVLLVDNGSTEDRSAKIRSRFPHVLIHKNTTNRGFAGGNNDGIKIALDEGADLVFLLNNDTIVAPGIWEALVSAFEQNPKHGVIGPIINYMDEPEMTMADGCVFNLPSRPGFFTRKPVEKATSALAVVPCDIVNGCAMAVRRTVLERIGLLDESFFIVHEESDFCLRARNAGFDCGILNKVLVWHKGSSSFRREGREHQRYFDARNLLPLLWRYGKTNGRSVRESLSEYIRYVYYRYCHEIEAGNKSSARACAEGLMDAVLHFTGPRGPRRARFAVSSVAAAFHGVHLLRSRGVTAG
jgi:GT2 family glycosyltransferase